MLLLSRTVESYTQVTFDGFSLVLCARITSYYKVNSPLFSSLSFLCRLNKCLSK